MTWPPGALAGQQRGTAASARHPLPTHQLPEMLRQLPRRCALHAYIAHFVRYQQQLAAAQVAQPAPQVAPLAFFPQQQQYGAPRGTLNLGGIGGSAVDGLLAALGGLSGGGGPQYGQQQPGPAGGGGGVGGRGMGGGGGNLGALLQQLMPQQALPQQQQQQQSQQQFQLPPSLANLPPQLAAALLAATGGGPAQQQQRPAPYGGNGFDSGAGMQLPASQSLAAAPQLAGGCCSAST
jgi:hypothetical protein